MMLNCCRRRDWMTMKIKSVNECLNCAISFFVVLLIVVDQ